MSTWFYFESAPCILRAFPVLTLQWRSVVRPSCKEQNFCWSCTSGIFQPKFIIYKFHPLTNHHFVDSDSGDIVPPKCLQLLARTRQSILWLKSLWLSLPLFVKSDCCVFQTPDFCFLGYFFNILPHFENCVGEKMSGKSQSTKFRVEKVSFMF